MESVSRRFTPAVELHLDDGTTYQSIDWDYQSYKGCFNPYDSGTNDVSNPCTASKEDSFIGHKDVGKFTASGATQYWHLDDSGSGYGDLTTVTVEFWVYLDVTATRCNIYLRDSSGNASAPIDFNNNMNIYLQEFL